ncbi:hypothetical protein FGO68_gene8034 [Halteria grandinella]|uniref:Uncharacterized protein n=1 Tax=Halteria grandinella TaxID=5974 RepID=A0A8J8NZQ4_HALGN|nr:hypothetical protein FGO68_gene8034 [Halteria grandinella]
MPHSPSTPLELPLKNVYRMQDCLDILQEQRKCESLYCLEFDLKSALPLQADCCNDFNPVPFEQKNLLGDEEYLAAQIRIIDQDMVGSTLYFYVNGECHGKKVLQQDLRYQLQGKKIVKSVQSRILDFKQAIAEAVIQRCISVGQNCGCGYYCNHKDLAATAEKIHPSSMNMRPIHNLMDELDCLGIPTPFISRGHILHAKMMNMTKSCAVQVKYQNLPNIEQFLTNFNQLVLQSGIIQKFFFSFDLPLSILKKDVTQAEIIKSQQAFEGGAGAVSPFSQILRSQVFPQYGGSSDKKEAQAIPQPIINILEEMKRKQSEAYAQQNFDQPSATFFTADSQPFMRAKSTQDVPPPQQTVFSTGNMTTTGTGNTIFNYQVINQMVPYHPPSYHSGYHSSAYGYPQSQFAHSFNSDSTNARYQSKPMLSNLDKFLSLSTPSFSQDYKSRSINLRQFFEVFTDVSNYGLKLLLSLPSNKATVVQGRDQLCIFVPTLSHIALQYYEQGSQRVISGETEESARVKTLSPQAREDKNEELFEQGVQRPGQNTVTLAKEVSRLLSEDESSKHLSEKAPVEETTSSQHQLQMYMENSLSAMTLSQLHLTEEASAKATVTRVKRMFEYSEEQPVYNRASFQETVTSIFEKNPQLAQLKVFNPQKSNFQDSKSNGEEDINAEESWFCIVWSLLKQQVLKGGSSTLNDLDQQSQGVAQGQQILVIYRFTAEDQPTGPIKLKVVGLLPLKSDDLTFWLTPQKEAGQVYSQRRLDGFERAAYKRYVSLNDKALNFINRHDETLTCFDFKAFQTQVELGALPSTLINPPRQEQHSYHHSKSTASYKRRYHHHHLPFQHSYYPRYSGDMRSDMSFTSSNHSELGSGSSAAGDVQPAYKYLIERLPL